MIVSLIAATTENLVLGKDNDLVWNLPDDMKYFMQKTSAHHVIMGRKNYDSIPLKFRPLPNRTNIVVTRKLDLKFEGCDVAHSIQEALDIAERNGEHEAFIIGGGQIYRQALDFTDKIYLTEIHATLQGDTFFPPLDKAKWQEIKRTRHEVDERHVYSFDFVEYIRNDPAG